ncbi:hypothetical protein [Sphingobacterium multivorum]|uniref:hypothetical protein n=1 Tax=Sphingobacterium multivorum TaxID=28454 RepID=UPI00345EB601
MHIIQKLSTYLNEKFETLTFIGFIVAGVFYGFGSMFFNQYTTLLYGLFSGLILVVFLKNLRTGNIMSMWPEGFFTFAVVLEFGFLLYDQVHLKNDWNFLPWAALLGGVVVVANGGLIMLKKIVIRNTVSKPLYLSAVFLLSTVYSYGFLSLTNIFNARQVVAWERAKVDASFLFKSFGGNDNYAKFENKLWGNRMMNLSFMEWHYNLPYQPNSAEIKVFEGNLGQHYMLKTYDEDEKNDARQID